MGNIMNTKFYDLFTLNHQLDCFIFSSFQYFVFDFHMAPVMLYDKIISLTVSAE